jgi:hypothetical protein
MSRSKEIQAILEAAGANLSLTSKEAELLKMFYEEGLMMYERGNDTVNREFMAKAEKDKTTQGAMKSLASKMSKL